MKDPINRVHLFLLLATVILLVRQEPADHSVIEPVPVLTLQEQLDVAARQSSKENKNITVSIPEGQYVIDGLTIGGQVSINPQGSGMRPVRFIYDGPDGESAENPRVVISIRGGYGKDIGNFEVRCKRANAKYLVFVECTGGANNYYHDIRIDHPNGLDCRGFVNRDRESAYVSRLDILCTQPLAIITGDNHYLECLDLKASTTDEHFSGTVKDVISVPIYLGMPKGWTIGGQNALHGGRQIIYCETKANDPTGNPLLISGGIRYEQVLSDSSRPAIEFNFANRSLEAFVVSGVIRSSQRTGPAFGWTSGKIWKRIGLDNYFELGKTSTVEISK